MRYIKPEMLYINIGVEERVSADIFMCIQTPTDKPIRGRFVDDDVSPDGCAGPVLPHDFAS